MSMSEHTATSGKASGHPAKLNSSIPKSNMSGADHVQHSMSRHLSASQKSQTSAKKVTVLASNESAGDKELLEVRQSRETVNSLDKPERTKKAANDDKQSQGGQSSRKEIDLVREREEYEKPMKQLYWNNEYLPMINTTYNNSKLPGYQYDHVELNRMQ